MKNKFFALITAVLLVICLFTGCEEEASTATPDEAASVAETPDEAQSTAVPASTEAGTGAAQPSTAQTQSTTAPADSTQPTTKKPVQENIPPDTIGAGNINPNIGWIQSLVISEINELAIRRISLDRTNVSVKVGESEKLTISYDPENAVPKTCTVQSSAKCVQASLKDGVVTVTGKSEGTATVVVTSYNGAKASCNVKVTKPEEVKPTVVTDDTVLPHDKVCTKANAERWRDAVDAFCAGTGMEKNSSLSGDTVTVSTADHKADGSFNSYTEQIVGDAAAQIDAYTDKNYTEYEYNCALVPDGNEFTISVTLYKLEPKTQ